MRKDYSETEKCHVSIRSQVNAASNGEQDATFFELGLCIVRTNRSKHYADVTNSDSPRGQREYLLTSVETKMTFTPVEDYGSLAFLNKSPYVEIKLKRNGNADENISGNVTQFSSEHFQVDVNIQL
ncbi:hypothetical protein ACK3Y2_20500 [Aeromonas caviae]